MRCRTLVVLAACAALWLPGLAQLEAADSFFQRMSPAQYRGANSATALPASTHRQLQPASAGLNRRGVHAPIDPQLQHRQWRNVDGVPLADQLVPRRTPTLEDMGTYLSARGIDPQRLDARFVRVSEVNATPAANLSASQPARQLPSLARPTIQSRQVRQGMPPEVLNVRLGKMYGVPGADHGVGDRSVGAGVGRVRSRR